VGLDEEVGAGRRVVGEALRDLAQRGVHVAVARIGADGEVVLHLHGHEEERAGAGDAVQDGVRAQVLGGAADQAPDHAQVEGHGVVDLVVAVVAEARPADEGGGVVGDVPRRHQREAVAVADDEVGRRQGGAGADDGLRVPGELAGGVQAVPFQHDPVGADVAHVGGDDFDLPFGGGGDGDFVIGALLAQQDHVGDAVAVQEAGDEGGPGFQGAAVVGSAGAAPEQPVPPMQVDAVRLVPQGPQRRADFLEQRADGPLQEEEALRRRGGNHGHSVRWETLFGRCCQSGRRIGRGG
jgi:hypothetical protein